MRTTLHMFTPRLVVMLVLVVVGLPFLMLLISGRWDWWEAYVYAATWVFGFVISRALAARRHPDLLAERYSAHADAKPWDRVLLALVELGILLTPLVAGVEARFGALVIFSLPVKLVALAVILAGYALGTYAMLENRFFSNLVRIQTDRGHQVVSSGPYRWLRHPGYAGSLLTFAATPLFLDSVWAFVLAALLAAILVLRTSLEDQTLQRELPGYREYAGRVRYRLLPGVW